MSMSSKKIQMEPCTSEAFKPDFIEWDPQTPTFLEKYLHLKACYCFFKPNRTTDDECFQGMSNEELPPLPPPVKKTLRKSLFSRSNSKYIFIFVSTTFFKFFRSALAPNNLRTAGFHEKGHYNLIPKRNKHLDVPGMEPGCESTTSPRPIHHGLLGRRNPT